MTVTRRLAIALLVSGLACALPIAVQVAPDARDLGARRLALAPLEAGPGIRGDPSSGTVAARVTGRLLEELTSSGFEVIPPDEASLALEAHRTSGSPLGPAEMARILSRQFRVDALATGRVLRYRRRSGGPRGAARPASVSFTLQVYDLQGRMVWSGDYDETQASVAGRPERLRLAFSRGFKWLTADQLIRFGAREIAAQLERDLAAWK